MMLWLVLIAALMVLSLSGVIIGLVVAPKMPDEVQYVFVSLLPLEMCILFFGLPFLLCLGFFMV